MMKDNEARRASRTAVDSTLASRPVFAFVLTGLAFALSTAAPGADHERGRLLYENHCVSCHATLVHLREKRKVRSIGQLREQVEYWRKNTGVEWNRTEIDDVVRHLDRKYYQLDETSTEG